MINPQKYGEIKQYDNKTGQVLFKPKILGNSTTRRESKQHVNPSNIGDYLHLEGEKQK